MYDQDSKGISYTAGFFMLIAFVIAGLLFTSQLMGFVWTGMTGKNLELLHKGIVRPEDSNALKIIQVLTAVLGFFIPTLLTAFLLNRKPLLLLGFPAAGTKWKQLGLVILIIGAGLLVASSLSYLTDLIPLPSYWKNMFDKMEDDYNTQVSAIVHLKTAKDYILAILIMGFLPALCEETLFRGGLQNFLTRSTKNPWFSIIVVSVLFSLAHISYYGFLSRIALGIVLGAIYYYSGKIWLNILAHFINNALAITVLFFYMKEGKPLKEAMKEDITSLWGLAAIPVLVILFIAFEKISYRRRLD